MRNEERETWRGWAPRWYLWDGGFFAIGRSEGVVPPHAHHAIQISLGLDGPIRFQGPEEEWSDYRGAIVLPDVTHCFDGCGSLLTMLFVAPESPEGRWLQDSLRRSITAVPEARMDQCVPPLMAFHDSPLEAMAAGELIHHTVRSLCAGSPPARRLDARVTRALRLIRESESPRISLEEVAGAVFLSPSRFAHLFSEHVGVPFRRYLLWRKLTRAMVAIGVGRTLTAAAHQAGFSDSAHLTRTFYQMFGTPPSVMMRGEFYLIPAPFDLPASAVEQAGA
jgi:AraC family transcriptional regulator